MLRTSLSARKLLESWNDFLGNLTSIIGIRSSEKMIISLDPIKNNRITEDRIFYRGKKIGGRFFILFFTYLSLGVVFPLIYAFWNSVFAYTEFGPSLVVPWSLGWLLLSLINLLILSIILVYRLEKSYPILQVNHQGLKIKYLFRQNKTLYWAEVQGITEHNLQYHILGIPFYHRQSIKLLTIKGKKHTFYNNLQDFLSFRNKVKYHCYAYLYPQLQNKLISGEIISFGAIQLDQSKLTIKPRHLLKRKSISWKNVSGLRPENGYLLIEFNHNNNHKNFYKIPMANLINMELMIRLIRDEVG